MNLLRTAVIAGLGLLVGGGYLGSYAAALGGTALDWHARMDTPPVRMVAAVLLVGAVLLALVPRDEVVDGEDLADPLPEDRAS